MEKAKEKIMRTNFGRKLKRLVILSICILLLGGSVWALPLRTQIGETVSLAQSREVDMGFDMAVLDYIQSTIRCDFLDLLMPAVTALGNGGILWIVIAATLFLFPKTRKTGLAVMLGLVLEVICCNVILKPFVARLRPFDVNTSIQLLIPRPTDFSFPSGHTGAAFASASALYFSKNRFRGLALILAALIGFSRLYLYVHYPTDVLAGVFIGILAGWCGYTLAGRRYAA